MAFHSNDGLFFARLDDGSVEVSKRVPVLGPLGKATGDVAVVDRIVVDSGTWASVMASVSARGEDSERWERARRFHG